VAVGALRHDLYARFGLKKITEPLAREGFVINDERA
jgi:hypothetical protein